MKWHLATRTISAAAILLLPVIQSTSRVSIEAGHVSEFNFETQTDSSLYIEVRETSYTTHSEKKIASNIIIEFISFPLCEMLIIALKYFILITLMLGDNVLFLSSKC